MEYSHLYRVLFTSYVVLIFFVDPWVLLQEATDPGKTYPGDISLREFRM